MKPEKGTPMTESGENNMLKFWKRNRFQVDVDTKNFEIKQHCEEMQRFSDRIRAIVRLDPKVVQKHDLVWDVGDYFVAARSFYHPDGWVDLFFTSPASTGTSNVGWSNIEVGDIGPDWVYLPKGTATIIYPKDEGLQQTILDQIRLFGNQK